MRIYYLNLSKMELNKQAVEEYIGLHYKQSPRTTKQYLRCLDRFIRQGFQHVNQDSLNGFLSVFTNNIFNRAFCRLLLEAHGIKDIEIPKPKTRQGEKIYKF